MYNGALLLIIIFLLPKVIARIIVLGMFLCESVLEEQWKPIGPVQWRNQEFVTRGSDNIIILIKANQSLLVNIKHNITWLL